MILRHACRLSLEGLVSKRAATRLSARARPGLDQVEMLRRGRNSSSAATCPPRPRASRLAGARLLRGRRARPCRPRRHRLHPRRRRGLFKRLEGARAQGRRPSPGSSAPTRGAASSSSSPNWSPRSSSAPGRPTASCATPPSAACARTSRRTRSCARAMPPRMDGEPGRSRGAVKLTHPDRVYWPDAGVTKEGLADYYAEVWPRMAPFVVNRPLALLRCPGGTAASASSRSTPGRGTARRSSPSTTPGRQRRADHAHRRPDG